jgi:hypothetical protein
MRLRRRKVKDVSAGRSGMSDDGTIALVLVPGLVLVLVSWYHSIVIPVMLVESTPTSSCGISNHPWVCWLAGHWLVGSLRGPHIRSNSGQARGLCPVGNPQGIFTTTMMSPR